MILNAGYYNHPRENELAYIEKNKRLNNCIFFVPTTHVETVCLLSNRKSKPDSYVDLSINMEDYHRIKNEEK